MFFSKTFSFLNEVFLTNNIFNGHFLMEQVNLDFEQQMLFFFLKSCILSRQHYFSSLKCFCYEMS